MHLKMVPCSGWESQTCDLACFWNILKPTGVLRQDLPLYCNSLPTQRKEKQQTNKFKSPFSTYPQQNGKRYFRPQKQNFPLNNASPFKETAGYSCACTVPMVP